MLLHKIIFCMTLCIALFYTSNAYAESDSPDEFSIGLSLVGIGEIDKKTGTAELDFWYSVSAEDPTVSSMPEMDFLNGRTISIQSEFETASIVEKRVFGTFISEMDFRNFPFEEIRLRVVLEPKTQWDSSKVKLLVNPSSGVDKYAIIPGWYISDVRFDIEESQYGAANSYEQFVAEFTIQRSMIGSFLKIMMPIIIVLGISFVAYMIPKNYDIVTELALLPLLALVFFHIETSNQLPPLGYLTLFDKLMLVSYALIANNVISTGRQVRAQEFSGSDRAWYLNNFHLKISPIIIVVLFSLLYFV